MLGPILLGVVFVVSLVMGVPVAISMGVASIAAMLVQGMPWTFLAQVSYTAVDKFPLIAVPLFILAGALMEKGGLTRRIIEMAEAIVGRANGGLGAVTVLSCAFFAALSGSGPAATAAIGMIMIPAMISGGYGRAYSGAVTACSGGLGIVIPPSIPMIIYGVSASVSITKLFIAGIIPGLILAMCLFGANFLISRRRGYAGGRDRSLSHFLRSMWSAKWAILAPVIILGGIYSGVFTVTEASVVAVVYAFFVGAFIHREFTLKGIIESLVYTVRTTGVVLLILGTAGIFSTFLTIYRIPELVAGFFTSITTNPITLMMLIIVLLIFTGMWMETIAQIIILTPILMPVARNVGIDPIHFGVVFVIACEIGFETPPVGANLFVATEISNSTIESMSREAIPFVLAETLGMVLVAIIPSLAMFLPNLIIG